MNQRRVPGCSCWLNYTGHHKPGRGILLKLYLLKFQRIINLSFYQTSSFSHHLLILLKFLSELHIFSSHVQTGKYGQLVCRQRGRRFRICFQLVSNKFQYFLHIFFCGIGVKRVFLPEHLKSHQSLQSGTCFQIPVRVPAFQPARQTLLYRTNNLPIPYRAARGIAKKNYCTALQIYNF